MSTSTSVCPVPPPARAGARLFLEFVGFAGLLFATRFLARGHLVPQSDQECHIGAIAADVLEHGIRFPLMVYAPNEYDNGSFFNGLLAAVSFALLGRSLLALKLVTHLISAAGAVATLWLLRGCLEQLGWRDRRVRWVAVGVLVIAIAFAPRLVTLSSLNAVGNHAEGSAIDTILLALFAWRRRAHSPVPIAAFWALVGLALYVNKGTALVIPVLAAAEVVLAWPAPRRAAAAVVGFALGLIPEALVIVQRQGMGWMAMASKAERSVRQFPQAFFDSLLFLGEYRIELMVAWAVSVVAGMVLLARWAARPRGGEEKTPPLTLMLVVAVTALHLVALAAMAKGGLEPYAIYGYPTLAVLLALSSGWMCRYGGECWADRGATIFGFGLIVLALAIYRPDAWEIDPGRVVSLWQNRAGAACFWRFAEGFQREYRYGLAATGRTSQQHVIERCRSFSAPEAVLDCIGGIARELNWRQRGSVEGEPPADLSPLERRAYAYHYGTHRKGDLTACGDFVSSELRAECLAAAQLECLVFADIYTRLVSGRSLERPRCAVAEPPMDGYWAAMRRELLSRPGGAKPDYTPIPSDFDLRSCQAILDLCY